MGAIKRLFIWNKMIEMPLWMSGMEKEPLQRSAYKERNMTLVICLSRIGSVGKGESNWMIHGIMGPPSLPHLLALSLKLKGEEDQGKDFEFGTSAWLFYRWCSPLITYLLSPKIISSFFLGGHDHTRQVCLNILWEQVNKIRTHCWASMAFI